MLNLIMKLDLININSREGLSKRPILKKREKENIIKFEVVSPIWKDPNKGMRFIKCNNEPINRGRLDHSKTFLKDIKKSKTYYW